MENGTPNRRPPVNQPRQLSRVIRQIRMRELRANEAGRGERGVGAGRGVRDEVAEVVGHDNQ